MIHLIRPTIFLLGLWIFLLACQRTSLPAAGTTLPYFGPEHFTQEQAFEVFSPTTKTTHRVFDFALADQTGHPVRGKDLLGKIQVVNFFFTSCPQVCPVVMDNLQNMQNDLPVAHSKDSDVVFTSISVDPLRDTPKRLRAYARLRHLSTPNWLLLTGDKTAIYFLARYSYLATLSQGASPNDDFIHTETVVLVDPAGRIRGFYNGSRAKDMQLLSIDIKRLQNERRILGETRKSA